MTHRACTCGRPDDCSSGSKAAACSPLHSQRSKSPEPAQLVDLDSTSPLTETSLLQPLPLHLAGRLLYLGCASGPLQMLMQLSNFLGRYPDRGVHSTSHTCSNRRNPCHSHTVPNPSIGPCNVCIYLCMACHTEAEPWGLPWIIDLSRQLHAKSNNANNAVRLTLSAGRYIQ